MKKKIEIEGKCWKRYFKILGYFVCLCVHIYIYIYICVCERERERERESMCVHVCVCAHTYMRVGIFRVILKYMIIYEEVART